MATIKLTGFNTTTLNSAVAGDNDTVDLDGSLTIGNNVDDAVIFNAEIDSDFIPDVDNTHDLGSASKKWRYGYFDIVNSNQRDIKLSYYNYSGTAQRFIRFNSTGVSSGTGGGVNAVIVAPTDGSLLRVLIRTKNEGGNTSIAFHKASNTTGLPINPWTATETQVVNINATNTTFQADFTSSTFNLGDILGVSITPTSGLDDVNITTVWLFDWNA